MLRIDAAFKQTRQTLELDMAAGEQIQAAAVWQKANGLWAKSDKTAIDEGKNYQVR